MAFNEKDGTGYSSFHKTKGVPSAGKLVLPKYSKMVNQELIQLIGYAQSITLNYHFQLFTPINPFHHHG